MREAKDPVASVGYLVEWLNMMLAYDPAIRIMGEMKPNETMDQAYLPTVGHWLGLAALTVDPARVGALIESAHSILAGLDPSDDMAYALYQKKLWSVHLNDQNGLKFDQDKAFGAVDLRRAFNQVWLLERNAYGAHGEFVGLDVKAVRTQVSEASTKHLSNSRTVFLRLVELARSLDVGKVEAARVARDYEELDLLIMEHLLGA
jgi:xylose isomerase